MKKIIGLLLLFCPFYLLQSQVFTDSNLPIVILQTPIDPIQGGWVEIPDANKITVQCKIIQRPNGARNYLADTLTPAFLTYNGLINIEKRGSSSQFTPKYSYGLTTVLADSVSNNNVSVLGMPAENDWILNGIAFDTSFMRDYISYNLARRMGHYAARTVYCEVILNNEYLGLYMFQEKIKADANRVDVVKILPTDNTLPNLSGGYITKSDKTTGGDPVAWMMSSYADDASFIHDMPKPTVVSPQQDTYIHGIFTQIATQSAANNSSLLNGYPTILDVPTFIDFMIINELSSNVDAYQFSTYFHKDRNGKLRAGPVWDCNLTYGNDLFSWGYDRSHTNVWQFSNGDNEGSKFWTDLFNDPNFRCYLSKRWNKLTQAGQTLNFATINNLIDSTATYINEASLRDDNKWNGGNLPNHSLQISKMKNWLNTRISWISNHIGGYTACANVPVPPLVITKIHYNPTVSAAFPSSDSQEFIEISNIGGASVNLSGIYFSALGISYQFPYNSTIAAHQKLFLAHDSLVFITRYGFAPFGQFTRSLSNSSQKLVLSDAFGNEIDYVEYLDTSPWPMNPDGLGPFLQLKDSSLDNSLASSWIEDYMTGIDDWTSLAGISVFPNPVNTMLFIHTTNELKKVELFEMNGNLLKTITGNCSQINFTDYAQGIYLLKIHENNSIWVKKVIKN